MENGYVYIARRADGRIKIGATRDPARRMLHLAARTQQRMELIVAAACAKPFQVEAALLALHAAQLVEGHEWFDMLPNEIARAISQLDDPDGLRARWALRVKPGKVVGAHLPYEIIALLDDDADAEGISRSHILRRIVLRHYETREAAA